MIYDKDALSNALIVDHAYTILNNQFGEGIKNKRSTDTALFVSVAVNCALSCELLLKSMLPQGTKGHKLDELFNKLDASDRTFIKESVVILLFN